MKSFPIRKSAIAFSLCLLTCVANNAVNGQNTSGPVHLAIVGLVHGHVAGFLPQLAKHPEIQLVGVEEPDTALASKYQSKYHLDPKIFYTNIDTMLERTHPQAILVYTAISDHRHAIEVAADHGVNVMVEKPLATSLADALAIRQTARAHHIQVLVNYETTWYASNHQAYELLQQGKLGELRKVIVRDGHQGPKEIGVGPEFLSWLTDPTKNGAGALFDFGCYGVDLMTWMMHGETPLSVTAVTQTDKPNLYPHVDDDATIILRYPKAQAVIMGSWNWTFDIKDMEVYGTTGTAFTQKSDHLLVRYDKTQPASLVTSPPIDPPNDSSVQYLEAVLAGALTPKGDPTALDTNVIVMQILDAARESARTGKTITLKPLPE